MKLYARMWNNFQIVPEAWIVRGHRRIGFRLWYRYEAQYDCSWDRMKTGKWWRWVVFSARRPWVWFPITFGGEYTK